MSADILAPARHVIGSRYVESVRAYILELTGLYAAKVVCGVDTFEKRFDRVRIYIDKNGIITDLRNS